MQETKKKSKTKNNGMKEREYLYVHNPLTKEGMTEQWQIWNESKDGGSLRRKETICHWSVHSSDNAFETSLIFYIHVLWSVQLKSANQDRESTPHPRVLHVTLISFLFFFSESLLKVNKEICSYLQPSSNPSYHPCRIFVAILWCSVCCVLRRQEKQCTWYCYLLEYNEIT